VAEDSLAHRAMIYRMLLALCLIAEEVESAAEIHEFGWPFPGISELTVVRKPCVCPTSQRPTTRDGSGGAGEVVSGCRANIVVAAGDHLNISMLSRYAQWLVAHFQGGGGGGGGRARMPCVKEACLAPGWLGERTRLRGHRRAWGLGKRVLELHGLRGRSLTLLVGLRVPHLDPLQSPFEMDEVD